MNYMKVYQDWIDDPFFDEQIRTELRALKDKSEIEDRFYRDLDFGTGGLRGVTGAGTYESLHCGQSHIWVGSILAGNPRR